MIKTHENVIICGDFNLVQNCDLDYFNYININNPRARQHVLDNKENLCLTDPFRELYTYEKRYTWRKRTPLKQARLDFFLISEILLTNVQDCTIENSYRSDHSPVRLILKFNDYTRGKGLWKHNNSLLYDREYVDSINKTIEDTVKQYALPVYDFDNISNIPKDLVQFTISDQLFLEERS